MATDHERGAIIDAALHNLMLDLNGKDESARAIVEERLGRAVTFGEAQKIVAEVSA